MARKTSREKSGPLRERMLLAARITTCLKLDDYLLLQPGFCSKAGFNSRSSSGIGK